MNRKYFLTSIVPASLMLSAFKFNTISDNKTSHAAYRKPPYLNHGDVVAITCTSGFSSMEEINPAVKQLESWGFKVVIGKTVGARDHSLGGTDQERAADLQGFLDNPEVKAILCARGGYGAVRIIDQIDFTQFKRKPKWIIGFSDVTVLHIHLNSNYHFASLHSKMCNSFPPDWGSADEIQKDTILSIESALKGSSLMKYQANYNPLNIIGSAEATLIGGNLRCIENLSGTKSAIETANKILFIEDVYEPLYNIDRMFYNLLRAGKLNRLKALIVGGFRIKKDDNGEEFGRSLEQIVLEKVANFGYPVCFDFPVGHQKNNYALKCGVAHRLSVTEGGTILEEI